MAGTNTTHGLRNAEPPKNHIKRYVAVASLLATVAFTKIISDYSTDNAAPSPQPSSSPTFTFTRTFTPTETETPTSSPTATALLEIQSPLEHLREIDQSLISLEGYPSIAIAMNVGGKNHRNVHLMSLTSLGIFEQDFEAAIDKVNTVFIPALSRYSPTFYKNLAAGNPRLILTTDLETYDKKGREWGNLDGSVRVINGMTTVFIEIDQPRITFDHEWYHLISHCFNFPAGAELMNLSEILANITKEAGLSYTPELSIREISSCNDAYPRGFMNCYGKWNADEDGATIAAGIMNGNKRLYKRIKTDEVLRQKVEAIIAWYDLISDGEMGKAYFDAIKAGKSYRWNE